MPDPNPAPVFDAFRMAEARGLLPTSLGTAELRELGAKLLGRSVFTARGTSAVFVSRIKEVVDAMASGSMDPATARVTLLETLRALNYTPEGGFPDAPGQVPPALKGTLQDLSSFRRIDLIVRTQVALMQGAGQQYRGHLPGRLESSPAWELIRIEPKAAPRDWPSRWKIAGGTFYGGTVNPMNGDRIGGRMIAFKGDPVWGELGSSANFNDALDVDHPPFAFNSGMGWKAISRAECKALGVTGSEGESLAEFFKGKRHVISGPVPMPSPSLSVKDVDPALVDQLKKETKAVPSKTNPGVVDFSDLLDESMEVFVKEHQERRAS